MRNFENRSNIKRHLTGPSGSPVVHQLKDVLRDATVGTVEERSPGRIETTLVHKNLASQGSPLNQLFETMA